MAAANFLPTSPEFRIRPYNELTDLLRADELEKVCEVGPGGKLSLFTDLLGDPLGRIRHYSAYAMLVAETEPGNKIVGLIRAGVKEVCCGLKSRSIEGDGAENHYRNEDEAGMPTFVITAYILGLRVSAEYRRLGIGAKLVTKMEEWCKERGVEYVYMATEKDNEASVNLFTMKLGYVKFRTPAILVQPVYARRKKLSSKTQLVQLGKDAAEALYRSVFTTREFFPNDIDAVFSSKLHKGTWVAYRKGGGDGEATSWAVMSLWKCNEIFKLEVKGAGRRVKGIAAATRALGRLLRWVTIPTLPNVFKPFGLQLMYGLHAEGKHGKELIEKLSWVAHNLAREDGCAVVAAELGSCDPLRDCIPHWSRFSCDEDLWCIKRLTVSHHHHYDWCKLPPPPSLFVDPRDF